MRVLAIALCFVATTGPADAQSGAPVRAWLASRVEMPVPVREVLPTDAPDPTVSGAVDLEVVVDASGQVAHARLVTGLTERIDRASLEAAQLWQFRPATRGARPIATLIGLRFAFTPQQAPHLTAIVAPLPNQPLPDRPDIVAPPAGTLVASSEPMPRLLACVAPLLVLAAVVAFAQTAAEVRDLTHHSAVLGEERNYRVFLPRDYDQAPRKRYPVIYFFHGWSERHNRPPNTGRGYDAGGDYNGDNIARFVGSHDVIVVKWDGSNPRKPGEDYPRPYNIPPETHRQFPLYFPELVEHIDRAFRTIADRDHRATAGLSMGGFMSFWVAGKYPHLVGSASNFMGSSEFEAGPFGSPSEYRHDEMHRNYEGLRTRLVIGARDFIRWYHRRMNATWDFTRPHYQHEEFDSEHGTPGMAKTLSFHLDAFRDPLSRPSLWHHIDVYPTFDVWGYSVQTNRRQSGLTAIENVTAAGFRSEVREWLPGGALMPAVAVRVTTDARYRPGRSYAVTDVNLSTREVRQSQQTADASGRLRFTLSGDLHEIGIAEAARPILVAAGWRVVDEPWATAGMRVRLALTILNKGAAEARNIRAMVASPNPGVTFAERELGLDRLAPGAAAEAREEVVVTVNDPRREILKVLVRLEGVEFPLEIPLFREAAEIPDVTIADGVELPVWERAVTRASRVVGSGNADGVADRGETVALAVRDGEAFRLVEVFASHPCMDVSRRVSDPWGSYDNVGASAKSSRVLVSSACPEGTEIPLFLRYQRPSKPEHVLVEGTTRLRIQGGP